MNSYMLYGAIYSSNVHSAYYHNNIACCVAYYNQCWRKRLLCRPLRNMFMQAFDDLLKPDLIQIKSTKKGISIYIIMHLCNVTM